MREKRKTSQPEGLLTITDGTEPTILDGKMHGVKGGV